jgi:aspartate/methionine/tyrosine aminotransferase
MPGLSRTASALRASVFADLAPRIEERARRGGDLVELHIGDTHLPPPAGARFGRLERDAHDALDEGLYRYGSIAGLSALKEALAERLAACGFGPAGATPANVLVGCGATHALFCAVRAVLDPGDEVLVSAPYWPLSVGVLRAAAAVPVEMPLTTRLYEEPTLDAAAMLEDALTPRTRAIYLITPNNPDGKVLSLAQLSGIARLASARNLWVIADEVYADYVYEGAHISIARLDGMAERTLTAYSLSKSHSLAGARVGFVVAPEPVIALARRVATHTVFNVPVASQRVALAALRAPAAWLDGARAAYRDVRDETVRALALAARDCPAHDGSAGLRAFCPEGGSYVFVDFSPILLGGGGQGPRGRAVASYRLRGLLEHAIDRGVLLAPGDGFGDAFGTWARLCFTAAPKARVLEGLARLQEAMRHWTASSDGVSD